MKKYEVTIKHHKYYNGGAKVSEIKEIVDARTERSAINKSMKDRKTTRFNVYCVTNVKQVA